MEDTVFTRNLVGEKKKKTRKEAVQHRGRYIFFFSLNASCAKNGKPTSSSDPDEKQKR